jgi:hypothetical protein
LNASRDAVITTLDGLEGGGPAGGGAAPPGFRAPLTDWDDERRDFLLITEECNGVDLLVLPAR